VSVVMFIHGTTGSVATELGAGVSLRKDLHSSISLQLCEIFTGIESEARIFLHSFAKPSLVTVSEGRFFLHSFT